VSAEAPFVWDIFDRADEPVVGTCAPLLVLGSSRFMRVGVASLAKRSS
jgi:hypothetical protein